MQVKKREAAQVFRKLRVEEKSSTHHVAGWIVHGGRKLFLVHYSRGSGDMPGRIGDKFIKSLKLSKEEFVDLRACRMSRYSYMALVRRR